MDIDHDTLVGFAKSWGLFYLIALRHLRRRSTRSGPRTGNGSTTPSRNILDEDDGPWQ